MMPSTGCLLLMRAISHFKPDTGITFDGKSTYIRVDDVEDFNVPAFSAEVWVRFDATHENQVFMNRGGAPTDFTFYLFDRVRFLAGCE